MAVDEPDEAGRDNMDNSRIMQKNTELQKMFLNIFLNLRRQLSMPCFWWRRTVPTAEKLRTRSKNKTMIYTVKSKQKIIGITSFHKQALRRHGS